MRYARVDKDTVVELFETDGDISEMFHPALVWAPITGESQPPDYGWVAKKNGDTWTFSEPSVAPPNESELKASLKIERDRLIAAADDATTGLADAYIAGLLDDQESSRFLAYAAYKLALSKICDQAGYPFSVKWPDWPAGKSEA